MKNLIKKIGIEKLEVLPIETLSLKVNRKASDLRYYYRCSGDRHKVGDYSIYDIVTRTIDSNIGKPFNEVFSEFCKKVPKYQQKFFLDEFDHKIYRWRWNSYTTDEEGNIQSLKANRKKKTWTLTGNDYKFELRHKFTGHKKDDFKKVYEIIIVSESRQPWQAKYRNYTYTRNGKFLHYEYEPNGRMQPIHQRYIAQDSDFEAVTTQGWTKTFDSKFDPEFMRIMREKQKASKRSSRISKKERAKKVYNFITKTEEEAKREREENKWKILKHGFDLETSFRKQKE